METGFYLFIYLFFFYFLLNLSISMVINFLVNSMAARPCQLRKPNNILWKSTYSKIEVVKRKQSITNNQIKSVFVTYSSSVHARYWRQLVDREEEPYIGREKYSHAMKRKDVDTACVNNRKWGKYVEICAGEVKSVIYVIVDLI